VPFKKILLLIICFCGLTSLKKPKFQYGILISANQTIDKIPKSISIKIVNSGSAEITLHNLIFEFYIDDDRYFGIFDKLRFFDTALVIGHNQKFDATINFDSLAFSSSIKNKAVSTRDFKKLMKHSKKILILATMSDLDRLRNPLESSTLSRSNTIEEP